MRSILETPSKIPPSRVPEPDVRERAYEQFAAAGAAWSRDPADVAAATQYVRALVALGLGGAARRILSETARASQRDPERTAYVGRLMDAIRSAPSGERTWGSLRRQYELNRAALHERDPAGAACLPSTIPEHFVLFRTSRGSLHVFDAPAHRWLGGLVDPQHEAESAFGGASALNPGAPIAFDGTGSGAVLTEFLRRSHRVFLSYSAAVTVIEPNPLAAAIWLHLADWTAWLAQPRFHVYVGPDASRRWFADLERDPCEPAPRIVHRIPLIPRPPIDAPGLLGGIWQRRLNRRERLRESIEVSTGHGDHRAWARRFRDALQGRAEPLRVLGITSRFTTVLQYSMRELLDAAGRAGCRSDLVIEPTDHANDCDALARIAAFRPDLLVLLSRMRYEWPELPRHIPFVTWDQDSLPCMRRPEAGASLDRLTFVVGYGAHFGLAQLGWPATQALATAPAAAAHRYASAAPGDDREIDARFRCDIAYISHCSETPVAMRDRLAAGWTANASLASMFRTIGAEVVARSAEGHRWVPSELHDRIITAARDAGVALAPKIVREMCMQCIALSDRAFRHCALDWVASYARRTGRTFRLYGNGWDRHPRFRGFSAGRTEFGDEFIAATRGARINLQLIEGGFVHSRALDGLAAGGFFLTRATRYDALRPTLRRLQDRLIARPDAAFRDLAEDEDRTIRAAAEFVRRELACSDEAIEFWIRSFPLAPNAEEIFPDLSSVAFSGPASLARLASAFLCDDGRRREISARMRAAAIEHFSYDAHWRQMIGFIVDSLAREP